MKSLSAIMIAFVLMVMPLAAADSIDEIRINGDTVTEDDALYVQLGETLNIRVVLESDTDIEGAQLQALIAGYRYAHYERDMVTDYTRTFNLRADTRRSFDLTVRLPADLEREDAKLRLILADKNGETVEVKNYQLAIDGIAEENAVQIRDFLISPTTTLEPGRALSFLVRVRNIGNVDLDDVTAEISIPGLNLRTFETIDSLEMDESKSFEALMLRIPNDARPGTYDVITTVRFDRFEEVREVKQITIRAVEEKEPERPLVMTVPEKVHLDAGNGARIVPILLENTASTAQTFTLTTSDVSDWGTARFEPSSAVVVEARSSKTVHLRVTADDKAEAGDYVFEVRAKHGTDVQTATVVAAVTAEEGLDLDVRAVLEWALVILIILLIVLGLVLLATKLRGRKQDPEDEDTQTYY